MKMLGRADTPCDKTKDADRLGMSKYAQALANFVSNCQTPMTVGIQGEWGSGKTSLMNMVLGLIEKTKETGAAKKGASSEIYTHWFQTWQYGAVGNDDTLGFHLMSDLIQGITSASPDDDGFVVKIGSRLGGMVGALAKAVVAGGANVASAGLIDGRTLLDAARDNARTQSGGAQLDQIKQDFQKLVSHVVADSGGRFVIFVDDLDRVRPGRAIMLLEILKNFMDVEHCVFVVACDYDVVREGVKERLGITDADKAGAFFHKIFQVPFQMPVETYNTERMLQDFLADKIGQSRNKPSDSNEVMSEAGLMAGALSEMVQLATKTNPRAFKRFLNVVELLSCVAETGATETADQEGKDKRRGSERPAVTAWSNPKACCSLIGLVALQTRWPVVATHLATCRTPDRVQQMLRTLRADTTADETENEDDQLLSRLRMTYGSSKDLDSYREHPEVQILSEFAELFFKVLDVDETDGRLSHKEVASLFYWAKQLSLTGVGKSYVPKGGWFDFDSAVRKNASANADGYLSVPSAFWKARPNFRSVGVVRTAKLFYTTVNVNGIAKTFTSFKTGLVIKLNGGPTYAKEIPIPGLAKNAARFVQECEDHGISWELCPDESYYTFDCSKHSLQGRQLDTLLHGMMRLHQEIDQLAVDFAAQAAQAASAAVASPTTADAGQVAPPPAEGV